MDWILAVTTLLVNSNLGWMKGRPLAWVLHAGNAGAWIGYAYVTEQWGFVVLSAVTVAIDLVSGWRARHGKES